MGSNAPAGKERSMTEVDTADLHVVDNPDAHRYEIWAGGKLAGLATYKVRPGRLVLIHTETEAGFEGHGVAARLVHDMLDDIRSRGLRITPVCPYVRHYLSEHPDYADLVAASSE